MSHDPHQNSESPREPEAAKKIFLSSFDSYGGKTGSFWQTTKNLLIRLGLALPWAALTGAFFGALILTLPSFFSAEYAHKFSYWTCDLQEFVPSRYDLAMEGIIQGSLFNMILGGGIVAYVKEPVLRKVLLLTGLIAGGVSWWFSSITPRTGI